MPTTAFDSVATSRDARPGSAGHTHHTHDMGHVTVQPDGAAALAQTAAPIGASLCANSQRAGKHADKRADKRARRDGDTRGNARATSHAARFWYVGFAAAAVWAAFGAITRLWPNKVIGFSDWAYTDELGVAVWAFAALIALVALALPVIGRAAQAGQARQPDIEARAEIQPEIQTGIQAEIQTGIRTTRPAYALRAARAALALRRAGPWLVAFGAGLAAWEVLTAKTALLPTPFFAPPQALIEVLHDDWARLGDSALHSLVLLGTGFAYGAVVGFLVGVSIGWSRAIGYWVHPVLRVLGPVPATALLPLAFYFFPSSYAAAVFLIALATSFPVAVLTWSGVASVGNAYYDVARTLGANPHFLVLRVAIPAALPQVFVGLFMSLSASFTVLVTAEMMGVKSGLGWYLSWAQGYAAYSNMYAALIVMALLFSGLITLLFTVRDRVLVWQKGTVKW